ncbi:MULTISPECIES: hypothetical protein [Methylosinus]|uniref:Uncharacterized protein n=1 Tax=Methylosinus trichosporium (strain ATCC 35070 / NCIMB 11131 / UNIQEM 75 / OB3b) TaxID=595536 RepID=A0A2D2CXJ5_METT3|nr:MULTISPECIES: hypothetical protein [Methylosinus]ATQ67406.1 hypothetical protein CQW49_05485 [Methylosinus trichosporium OB3b]OBS51582.1 hypothetical protein A8B73_15310 [Methylosinus sp. 3S-1]
MSLIDPPKEKRPSLTPEALARFLIAKAATGDPGANHLLEEVRRRNPRLFARLDQEPDEAVSFEPKKMVLQ